MNRIESSWHHSDANNRKLRAIAIAYAIMAAGLAQTALAASVDEFTVSQAEVIESIPGNSTSVAVPGSMLGGWRILTAEEDLASAGSSVGVLVDGTILDGIYAHRQGALVVGRSSATWDGAGTGAGCLNLDLSGASDFELGFISADNPATIVLRIHDGVTTGEQNVDVTPLTPPQTFSFPIGNFVPAVTLSNICYIQLEIDGVTNPQSDELDLTLGFVRFNTTTTSTSTSTTTVPVVPAAGQVGLMAMLAGLPLIGAVAMRMRRRR